MGNYEESKKARRIAAVVFILFMSFILGGTYINQQSQVVEDENSIEIIYPQDSK